MKTKYSRYESVAKEFKKFFSSDELSETLRQKADLKMLDDMNIIKANKKDFDRAKRLIDNLNERVKHISTLQSEIARSLNPIRK